VELRDAKEQAEEANRAKDHFLAVLSHELRTPLTPVLASVQALQSESAVAEDLAPLLDIIRRNVELEARLIDDLLDLTRIERGKLQLNSEVVDVAALLENVLDICAPEIAAKRLIVTTDLRAPQHHVQGDSARLQQVFWNLIKNAVKFTPEGGEVTIAASNDTTGRLGVTIADTGIGIAPDFLLRIFNAFEQGERTINKRFGGLGLGLAISRTLVDLHGGHLTAASDGEGRGASFTVDLPTVPRADLPGRDQESPVEGARSGRGVKVLLVEDHIDTRNVMRMFLEQRGYDVRVADGVTSALAAADEPFDLLISDIGLPDGSGLDLIRALSARGPVKGIALSGFGMDADLQRSREAGFLRHLTKPVNGAVLQEVIESIVGRSS
jgi:CheY-like chemotaxis protein